MINKLDSALVRQLFFFGIVGISATLTHYFVALLSHDFLGVSLYIANLLGYCSAVAISYFGHSKLTFSRELNWLVFTRFVVVSVCTFGLSELILWGLESQIKLHHALSLAVVVCTIPVITFLLSKLWVFRP